MGGQASAFSESHSFMSASSGFLNIFALLVIWAYKSLLIPTYLFFFNENLISLTSLTSWNSQKRESNGGQAFLIVVIVLWIYPWHVLSGWLSDSPQRHRGHRENQKNRVLCVSVV